MVTHKRKYRQHFAANSEVHKFTKQVWGLWVGGKMASPVDLLRPPISEVRLETTQFFFFGISWNSLLFNWEAM